MPDFKTLSDTFPTDRDYPERAKRLQMLERVVAGTLYDNLKYPFSDEKSPANEYIPLKDRRPSVRTRICATVVNDSVAMLFSEGHFPTIATIDENVRAELGKLITDTRLNEVMIEAALRGSVGSIAILMRVLNARVFFKIMPTCYLTPSYDPKEPDRLQSVQEKYKVKGRDLTDAGYAIEEKDANTDFWFSRLWDETTETWFLPQKVSDDDKPPKIDAKKTVRHNFGFCPIAWIKNLPGGDDVDGASTFPIEAIDTQIEADYLLSQGGRGLKYQSDPTLLIKEPAFGNGSAQSASGMVKGAANALIVATDGDAKLLEISGDAANSVMQWVKGLRDIALEGASGVRADPDKLTAAKSGRAMELMNESLIRLADKLRISYGQGGLLDIITMVVKASNKFKLKSKKGKAIAPISQDAEIGLQWPRWYAPTYEDQSTQADALLKLRGASLLSQETCVKSLAPTYDIQDTEAEIKLIDANPPDTDESATADKAEKPGRDAADSAA